MNIFTTRQYSRKTQSSTLITAALLVSLVLLTSLHTSNTAASSDDIPEPAGLVVGSPYRQTNLVSDLPGVALVEDRLLRAPWGVATNAGGPFAWRSSPITIARCASEASAAQSEMLGIKDQGLGVRAA